MTRVAPILAAAALVFSLTHVRGASAFMGTPGGGVSKPAPVTDVTTKVEKASGPDAYTVGEIHSRSAELDRKTVSVRGKVVKVSQRIMGKNWVHLRDGSGDATKGTNNLVVTSQDLPSVGDVVTAKGTVANDKDFGSGYRYVVIMEDASVKP